MRGCTVQRNRGEGAIGDYHIGCGALPMVGPRLPLVRTDCMRGYSITGTIQWP